MLFNANEYIKDLINSGFTREEAIKEANKEIKKRKKSFIKSISIENAGINSYKDKIDRYKR